MTWQVIHADCIEAMRDMDAASVDAIVTDPPYGLEFMGKEWDRLGATVEEFTEAQGENGRTDYHGKGNAPFGGGGQRVRYGLTTKAMQDWHGRWATEALRVLKPGAHLLAFGGTRTYHRLTCALEDTGFEIRDCLSWLYGSGFPKSLDVSKAIDKAAGAAREVLDGGATTCPDFPEPCSGHAETGRYSATVHALPTAPTTEAAQRWQGWGTALKPAHEPIVLARKPLGEPNVAANVRRWGTGALNIDGTRIGFRDEADERESKDKNRHGDYGTEQGGNAVYGDFSMLPPRENYEAQGRWPANVLLDPAAAAALDEQTGEQRARGNVTPTRRDGGSWFGAEGLPGVADGGDTGGASRFFYVASDGGNNREDVGDRDAKSVVRDMPPDGPLPVPLAPGTPHPSELRFRYVPKADREERERGLEHMPTLTKRILNGGIPSAVNSDPVEMSGSGDRVAKNHHPTVKPVALMAWLCRLITPPGGTVLDPFTGSGSTGIAALREGFDFVGIEREPDYVEIARARIQGDAPLFNVGSEVGG